MRYTHKRSRQLQPLGKPSLLAHANSAQFHAKATPPTYWASASCKRELCSSTTPSVSSGQVSIGSQAGAADPSGYS